MASIQDLPADQKAVLELVLRRGRSYDEIAEMLSIDRAGVRQRALAALDALGPQTRVAPERRALITDYLLGALPPGLAEEVHSHLSQSASERAWARAVSTELQGIAERPLPEIPADAGIRMTADDGEAPVEDATASKTRHVEPGTSHRRGGAVLLIAGAAIVVAVVLILVLPGSGHKKPSAQARPSAAVTGSTGTTGSTARVVAAIALKPPSGAKSPLGFAEVIQARGQFGIAIAAQGLNANSKHPPNAYAVWLYNSPADSKILGFVNPAVGSNGQLKTAGGLPSNASHYQKLLVTLETSSNPKSPGRIILEGQFRT
jgi:hypothetical protein